VTRSYALYFDTQPHDSERRVKQGVALLVIALHLLALIWALRTHPVSITPATSLVVVQLNGLANAVFPDRIKRDVAQKQPLPKPAAARPRPLERLHNDTPAGGIDRPLVAEAHERGGSSDNTLPESGALAANADANAGSAAGNHAAGGRGSLWGPFRPPQVIQRVRMTYPKAAVAANAQGDVDVLVTVGADGLLRAARIDKSSGNADLDAASLQLIQQYRFKAAEKDGVAVEADAIINLDWRIGPRERFEFARLPKPSADINLDAQLKAVEFLGNVPSHRMPCDQMKNPDCLATPSGE